MLDGQKAVELLMLGITTTLGTSTDLNVCGMDGLFGLIFDMGVT